MLLIYEKATGRVVGINTSHVATFENMYPDAAKGFKEKYDGILVPYNPDYDKNRNWYKVEGGKVVKLDSPFAKEAVRPKVLDPRDQEIEELKSRLASLEKTVLEVNKFGNI